MYLTPEQREIGRQNFLSALGAARKDFLEKSLSAAAPGPFYFGYGGPPAKPVRAAIVGTGNEGCEAMIRQSPPAYLEYVAFHDIRPTQIERARKTFESVYGSEQAKKIKFHEKWKDLLADSSVEAVVIATPLWTHARFAIEAIEAGKHVLCEKLMAHNVTDAKAMVRAAEEKRQVLSIGHQRHYSALYDNALAVIRTGALGTVKHIRALWHRNNTWNRPDGTSGDSWSPPIPEEDKSIDVKQYGYKSIEELVRWRLYDRTGGGLMAELGSHQLDACSLFLEKAHPLHVSSIGGKYYFDDDRECEDHVYCTYQMPNGVIVTYSSINTNALEGYGEIVMGTKGTLMILNERDLLLFKEREPGDPKPSPDLRLRLTSDKKLAGSTAASPAPEAALAELALERASSFVPAGGKAPMSNRGYREELEAFAHAVRNPGAKVRCDGRTALADAVMALSANVAMRSKARVIFKDSWYDPSSADAPDPRPNGSLARGS